MVVKNMKRKKTTRDVELRLSRMKIKEGDTVLVKSQGEIEYQSRLAVIRSLGAIQPKANVMFLPSGMDMEGISEEDMNKKGWYRGRVDRVRMQDMGLKYDGKELLERLGFKR